MNIKDLGIGDKFRYKPTGSIFTVTRVESDKVWGKIPGVSFAGYTEGGPDFEIVSKAYSNDF